MGGRCGGHAIATSFAEPLSPVPDLSPAVHVAGNPARNRRRPVLQFFSQINSVSREAADNVFPTSTACMVAIIAFGVVVSRGSAGRLLLRLSSTRSNRVVRSPIVRKYRVSAGGPPMNFNKAFAAVLSLASTAASQSSKTESDPAAACCRVTGEWAS